MLTACLALLSCGGINRKNAAGPVENAAMAPAQDSMTSDELSAIKETIIQPSLPGGNPANTVSSEEYRIGEDDELEISVYGDTDLVKTQTVRPGGKIAFPLLGDVQASGLTADELRERIGQGLSKYVVNPRVTVIITKYNSKQVVVLGEVKAPGVIRLSSDVNIIQAISRVGGNTDEADLRGALLVRDGQILAVDFERLLRQGDFSHNLLLRPNDTILIPHIAAKKVFVLGEVTKPLVVQLKHGVTLIEAIVMAGGFTRDAELRDVLILRGGLGAPHILEVNLDAMTKKGHMAQNVLLQPGDIIYVPRTLIANVERFFERLRTILTPIVLAETGIALLPTVKSVFTRGETPTEQPVIIGR